MNKLIVFGATRGTGKLVVEQALLAGYQVTAIVRNPAALDVQHRNLKTVKGDVLELISFKNEMKEQDAVISCLGIPKIQETNLYSQGMRNIVDAMQASGLNRILCISSGAISIPPKVHSS